MTIAEVSKKYDISADTLRYYERVGMIPPVTRTASGIRDYQDSDLGWVGLAKCMRSAGLPVEAMIEYVRLYQEGDSTIPARLQLLLEQRQSLLEQKKKIDETLDRLNYKISIYEDAVKTCFELDNQILVEDFIKGREFSIGVINKKALPVVEIIPRDGWYDYKNKYNGATEEVCPANLNDELTKKIQKVAEDACNAIGCEPYARADVMMDADGNMFCLEVNTLPGMTATSLVPQEAKAVGMDFPTLCDYLVELSLKKNN